MKHLAALLFGAALLLAATASAQQNKPLWVRKGVKTLDKQRTNDSYAFRSFDFYGEDAEQLERMRHLPLLEQTGRQYRIDPDRIECTPVDDASGRPTYRLSFTTADGASEIYAQLVDDWTLFEDDVDKWGFGLHQLYAVSKRNVVPDFDTFTTTDRYGIKPMFMSLIPGLGQIYKGQPAKGYAFLGTEIVMAAGIAYSELERLRYVRLGNRMPDHKESYDSTVKTYRQLRNICIIAGGAVYIYNLIDAAVAKGARRVIISRPDRRTAEFAFVPVVTEFGAAGIGMSVTF